MSKYTPLWEWLQTREEPEVILTFTQVETIAGVSLDHSILRYKKELPAYGWEYGKISLKRQTVTFQKIQQEETL